MSRIPESQLWPNVPGVLKEIPAFLRSLILKLADRDRQVAAAINQYDDVLYDHASRHQSGGEDELKLDDLGQPDDNTDLDATTSAHGLCPKLPNDGTKFLDGQGNWSTPEGGLGHAETMSRVSLGI